MTRGSVVPVTRESNGKNRNFMMMKATRSVTTKDGQVSFCRKSQNFFMNDDFFSMKH